MKSNIGYLKSAGIGILPPVEEVEHIYDELPYEEPTATISPNLHECGEEKDQDYVNDPQGEAYTYKPLMKSLLMTNSSIKLQKRSKLVSISESLHQ